ncbi:mercury(II) reductase [Caldivirga maquilingensis]|uniref:Mercuric reductase n=1 Tax=Caldivirga maquilingensis (strain ATCC 700844 / DSM 13496 / JCM 10307 / IC-167) TaxID=397948 RepID=A8M9A9_CALMQ|nr:mercury(II) reductase [Caldivirga maquilingensis]ABW02328.1 mercuric reductase [Caldivirga maquilingensis IC-167]
MAKELVIIGYGAAGFAALIRANELGIKPTLIGYGPLGGTCVNVGCVPSKTVLRIGELYGYAKGFEPSLNWDYMSAFKHELDIVNKLRKLKYEDVLAKYDVELIEGRAYFTSPNSVKVNGRVIEGERFIVATGSSPNIPNIKGLREVGYWTNVEALNPQRRIGSLIVLGGRAQALEFAQMYRMLGVDVAVVQRSQVLIPDWEPEISLGIRQVLEQSGVVVLTGTRVLEVKQGVEGKVVVTDKGELEADEILVAMGRRPNVDLNLNEAGIKLSEKGGILVDDELRTTNPRVYAAGDVLGGPMLEALAGKQGVVAVDNAVLNAHRRIDMLAVPQAIFTKPNLARVGLTVAEAVAMGIDVDYRVVFMDNVAKAHILGDTNGLVKMIIEKGSGRIIGVHAMGENAAEFINEAALAIRLKATINDLIDTIHVFPTMAESLKLAAQAFYRDITKMSCCVD